MRAEIFKTHLSIDSQLSVRMQFLNLQQTLMANGNQIEKVEVLLFQSVYFQFR